MAFITITGDGIQQLRDKINLGRMMLPALMEDTAKMIGEDAVQIMSDAAPYGSEGTAPAGDVPGHLADSFTADTTSSGESFTVTLQTNQPTKLSYVTQGTGIYGPRGQRIVPTTARALNWPSAPHPVRSVAGQQPNDFVTPAIDEISANVDGLMNGLVDELTAAVE